MIPGLIQERITHYHGDIVRSIFFIVVAFSFLVVPLWGHLLPFGNMFEIAAGISFVVLAGLTNPHSRGVMYLNIAAAALGAFLFELAAISFRSTDPIQLLFVREAAAVLLLTALYFSIKTARAMRLGKIGEVSRPWEFEKENEAQQ